MPRCAVQEMYDEYMHSAQLSGALSRAPRLKVFLFPATEEDASILTPEQDLEGYDFFESTRQVTCPDQEQQPLRTICC